MADRRSLYVSREFPLCRRASLVLTVHSFVYQPHEGFCQFVQFTSRLRSHVYVHIGLVGD